jgi:hypothetical protein
MRHMVVIVPMQTGYAGVRYVEVSVPYVAALIGDGEKYYMEPKRIEGAELRRQREPSLRFLVKLALRCQSAEELGKKIRRRYQRQQQRQGIAPPSRSRAGAELAERLDRLLAQD